MSIKHPIIAVTGSSGAGTSTITRTFARIFEREGVNAAIVEGDAFHAFDRAEMHRRIAEETARGNPHFSHFGPDTNLFQELESLFADYARTGTGKRRKYLHDSGEAAPYQQEPGTFTPWEPLPENTDLLFYEGLHGGLVTETHDMARFVDLLIGVVPIINLEWIQKLWRDRSERGYSTEAVTDTILRDAHQSLLATRMRTDDMLPICDKLDKVGYWSLEVWGGATFDACVRFLKEDPWERLRKLRAALPNTRLQMLLRGQNLLGYRHYSDDVVKAFVAKAAVNGIDVFRIFDAMNDVRNLRVAIEAVKAAGKHAQGTIAYTTSPVHTIDAFVAQAKQMESMGCDSVAIKDMAGCSRHTPPASWSRH